MAALLFSCSDGRDLPPLTQEGEKVIVGSDLGVDVCAGDLRFLDDQVRYVEELLAAPKADPIPVYVYIEAPDDCDEGASGCYLYDEGIALGAWRTMDHEVVHAVVDRLERPPDFWNEGLAEALRPRWTRQGVDTVLESVNLPHARLDYWTAGHFVRWLHLTYGEDKLRELVRGASIEEIYGADIDSLSSEFEDTAPWSYPSRAPCDAPSLNGADAHWDEEVQLDCFADDTSRFGGIALETVSIKRSVRVETEGLYRIAQTGGSLFHMIRCQTSIVAAPPLAQCYETEDVPCETDRSSGARLYEANSPHELHLPEGDYLITMSSEEGVDRGVIQLQVDLLP